MPTKITTPTMADLPFTPATQRPTFAVTQTVTILTRAGEILIEQQHDNPQSASSAAQCEEILKTEVGCNVVDSVQEISRPEWSQLLPYTRFYLGHYFRYILAADGDRSAYFLIVEQAGKRYIPETYDLLLEANSIVITDENRELIAKAWALMTVPDYLREEILFTKWKKVGYTVKQARHPYNYTLQAWTELGGWEVDWWFVFGNTRLDIASGPSAGQPETGNYMEQPFVGLNSGFYSPFQDYFFTGR